MKIGNAIMLWLFVFSLFPIILIGYIYFSEYRAFTLIASVSCGILVIGSIILAYGYYFKPIFSFIDAVKGLNSKNPDFRLPYSGNNEVGELARAFNGFIERSNQKNQKLEKETLELIEKENQYRLAMELKSDIYFEVDPVKDTFTANAAKWECFFGSPCPPTFEMAREFAKTILHPEDQDAFVDLFKMSNLMDCMKKGQRVITIEARILNADSVYIWSSNTIQVIPDKSSQIAMIFGYITSIECQKKLALEKDSLQQKDGLTELLSKQIVESQISNFLDSEGKGMQHALLVIDIDNFKQINDTMGHLYGDAVLKELANNLTKLFRNSDIIGRIGGDEFVILLKHVKFGNLMMEKANALLDMFESLSGSLDGSPLVSGSIGIAEYPKDGTNYYDLFSNADKALYKAKKRGKCTYCFYSDAVEREKIAEQITQIEDPSDLSDETMLRLKRNAKKSQIAEYIFQILYESKNTNKSIEMIMEMIGRFCHVSRVYIFRNAEDNTYATYTHEWCAENVDHDIEIFSRFDYGVWRNYQSNFDNNGVFYCQDTSKLPLEMSQSMFNEGIYAFLECAILDEGKFVGFIGFDECTGKRLWKKDEIDTLILVAKILTVFLRGVR